ncbi:MAG: Na/Pi cotransporter family protein, partial [Romboutsia sp.]|uniref:Na/Pi cotransporter family protein n=1 Tax=Romboutsia sp. TaxID=1965302 RepID=UPI003F38A39D
INPNDVARQLANTHTLFNILSVLLLLPFSKYIVKLAMKIIPEGKDEKENETYLDERILETPSIAFGNTIKETTKMATLSNECLNVAMNGFFNKSQKEVDLAIESSKRIKDLQRNILSYLLKLSKTSITKDSIEDIDNLFSTINDLERIGAHSENIAELSIEAISKDLYMSDDGIKEIKQMYEKVKRNCENTLKLIVNKDKEIANKIINTEEEVNKIEKAIRVNHIYRLNNNECKIDSGILYLELITNLERISDHCSNIAKRDLS